MWEEGRLRIVMSDNVSKNVVLLELVKERDNFVRKQNVKRKDQILFPHGIYGKETLTLNHYIQHKTIR